MYYINGKLLDKGQINIDEGIFFGLGVFETVLMTDKPIFLELHLYRLNNGLERLGVDKYIHKEEILDAIKKIGCKNCAIRITVTQQNTIITKRPIPYTRENYKTGFKLGLSDIIRNSTSPLTYIKSLNYADNMLARRQAEAKGYNELLFLNENNFITEGTVSNIFFIRNNKIYTPSSKCGLLKGIIRDWVINKYQVEEGFYSLEDLLNCDEIFLTNSLMGIMPVKRFNDRLLDKNISLDILFQYQDIIGVRIV